MRQFFRSLWGAALLVLLFAAPLALAVLASSEPPETVWLSAPGWSRARVAASTALDEPTPLVADDAGSYLLLARPAPGAHQPVVLALDSALRPRWEHSFSAAPARISSPRLVRDGAGLAALWISQSQLYLARLGGDGAVLAEPAPISGDARVSSYAVASGGGRTTVWYASAAPTPGLFALVLGDDAAPLRVAEQGVRPWLQYDEGGALHAVWLAPQGDDLALMYASFADGAASPAIGSAIATIGQSDLDAIAGPQLGLSGGSATAVWSETTTSGMSAGQRLSRYVSLTLGQPPQPGQPRLLTAPGAAEPSYGPAPEAGLRSGPRMALDPEQQLTGIAPGAISVGASGAELALIGETQLPYRASGLVTQAAVLYLSDGQPAGYQLLTRGPRSALAPSMAAAPSGSLLAAWHEVRRDGVAVYVAGTAPETVAALAQLDAMDAARMLNDTIFGMVSGVLFSPITMLLWLAPALLALLVTWPLRRAASFERWAAPLSVALAVGVYWAAKLALLQDALGTVPFAAWVPVMPQWLGPPLQLAVPALIALVAGLAAWQLTYARGRRSAALLVLAYGAIDALLSMAVYGMALYG